MIALQRVSGADGVIPMARFHTLIEAGNSTSVTTIASRMAIVSMIPILAMPQWSDIDRLPKETIVVKALSTMARGVLVAKKRRGSPI